MLRRVRTIPAADARRLFRDTPIVRVATLLPDGDPHVVPLWFVWLEEGVYVTCRRSSRVWANLVRDPRVALEFDRGRAWPEHQGLMLSGRAELLGADHPAAKQAISAWFEKYRTDLGGSGFEMYADQVAEPALFRLRPDRIAAWSNGGSRPAQG
jgi:nitroimidazol reductase NimA-like FMN-containing flavoprotein (pyridoxamine 5'-phosphate oxidase superfamily)